MSCLCAVYSNSLVSSDDSSDDGGGSSPLPFVKHVRSEYKNSFNRSLDLDLFFSSSNGYEEDQIQERVTHCAAKYHAAFAVSSDSDDDFYKNPIVISSSDDESAPKQKSVEQHQAKFSRAVDRAQTVARAQKKNRQKPLDINKRQNPELIQEKQPRNNWCLRVCAAWSRYKAE